MFPFLLSGCVKEDFDEIKKAQEKTNAEAIFGVEFDKEQDWCTTMSGNCRSSRGVSGTICSTLLLYVIMLIHAVSNAYGSSLRVAIISANPTFTDSIGSPFIEPDVSINM